MMMLMMLMMMMLQQQTSQEKLVVLRKHRQRVKSEANWKLFYYQFNRDHARPNLIWNFKVCICKQYRLHVVSTIRRNLLEFSRCPWKIFLI